MEESISLKHRTTIITPEKQWTNDEEVALETPYTIALNDEDIGSSMVLPVGLKPFGVGFLFGQGYIKTSEQVKEVIVCKEGRISVYADVPEEKPKELIITSGCGGTGKIPKEMLEDTFEPLEEYTIDFKQIKTFIRQTLSMSDLGNRTHCVHGCGFWQDGKVKFFFEDVGRHNAVDKILGAILLEGASPAGAIYTTGRLTSDMVLKCARMGIPVIMSRTSASSLGLAIARQADATLIAYARPERVNVYHHPQRIITGS